MIGLCPLCKSEGVEHPAQGLCVAGASCSEPQCILHIGHQDYCNVHVLLTQWPQACVFEARTENGLMPGIGRTWCQVHGFDCPLLTEKTEKR